MSAAPRSSSWAGARARSRRSCPSCGCWSREAQLGRARLGSPAARRAEIKDRLRELSNRFAGRARWPIRREPVPAAYRVFFRHIGLDPDVDANADRGGGARADAARRLSPGGLLEDVLLIALVDTGVPVWALDADGRRRPARHPLEPRGRAAGRVRGRAAAAGRAAGRGRRLGGAGGPVRRARPGPRAGAPRRAV